MKSRSTKTNITRDESGIFVVILAGTILAFLMLIGLALDSSNLYRTKLRAQNALDGAAIAGATAYVLEFRSGAEGRDQAKESAISAARSVVEANYELHSIPFSEADFSVEIPTTNQANDTLEVIVNDSFQAPLLLLHMLPGFGSSRTVAVSATAEVKPAVVSTLLDLSGSMLCPASGGCECAPNCSGELKIDRLIDAVKHFVEQFDPEKDRLNVVAFRLGAQTIVPMREGRGFDRDAVLAAIDGLANDAQALSATNPTDAFLQAHLDINRVAQTTLGSEVTDLDRAFVLFTDGAPTATRFLFTDPIRPVSNGGARGLRRNDPLGFNFDYFSWSVDWNYAGDVVKNKVMRLLRSQPDQSLYSLSNTQMGTRFQNDELPFARCSQAGPSLDVNVAFQDCLDSFEFTTPGGGAYGAAVPFADFRKQYYNTAITMADYVRSQRGIIYTIGLGVPAAITDDPYQDALDSVSRKDIFLTRLAMDSKGPRDAHPEFPSFPVQGDYSTQAGVALGTDTVEDIDELFRAVARRIKLLLVR